MEYKVNFSGVLTHAHVKNLACITELVNRLVPNACTAHLLTGFKLGSVLPNIISALKSAHGLAVLHETLHRIRAHVNDDLLRDFDSAPCCRIEFSSIKMPWEHEDMLIMILTLSSEVLAKFTYTRVDAVHPFHAWVALKFQLPPRSFLVDVRSVELAQVKREPVHDPEEMCRLSLTKSRNVLIVRNQLAFFSYTVCFWTNCSIRALCRSSIRWSDVVLSVMAGSVPCMANPNHSNEHSLFALLRRFKGVTLCLKFIVGGNDTFLSTISYNFYVCESEDRSEKIFRILSILSGIFPW